ncbi:MAG TPA: hypothetical protein VH414_05405 [Lichenihabitans sp.]|jgi:multiple sugar transport system permease protein|nr:hypothetical protein [Lichenihabitans sp.]
MTIGALSPARRLARMASPWGRRLVLWLFAVWCLFPVYWLVTMSLKQQVDVIARPPRFLFTPVWDNYQTVLRNGDVWGYLANSLVVALGSTALARPWPWVSRRPT